MSIGQYKIAININKNYVMFFLTYLILDLKFAPISTWYGYNNMYIIINFCNYYNYFETRALLPESICLRIFKLLCKFIKAYFIRVNSLFKISIRIV